MGTNSFPCKCRTAILKLDHRSRALNRSVITSPRMRTFRRYFLRSSRKCYRKVGGGRRRRREVPAAGYSEWIAASAAARTKLDNFMYSESFRELNSGSDAKQQCVQLLEAITPRLPIEQYLLAVERLRDPTIQEAFLVMAPDRRAQWVWSWK
ncbi:hypothetical protein I3843_14G076800 [Carya illinoinensis]|nr:hypothetical protein I3843_14G076800 [Carya illinoinensis]